MLEMGVLSKLEVTRDDNFFLLTLLVVEVANIIAVVVTGTIGGKGSPFPNVILTVISVLIDDRSTKFGKGSIFMRICFVLSDGIVSGGNSLSKVRSMADSTNG